MAQDLIIEDEFCHNSTQMSINQYLSISLSTAWRAGQESGQRRIAQYFLPELGLPLSLSCENVCPECLVSPPDTTPGPPLALTLTGYIRPVLGSALSRTPAPASYTHTHARPGQSDLLQTDWRLTEVATKAIWRNRVDEGNHCTNYKKLSSLFSEQVLEPAHIGGGNCQLRMT